MKHCSFCNAEMPEDSTVCPSCGKDNAAKPKGLKPGGAALVVAAAVALVILALAILFGAKKAAPAEETVTEAVTEAATEAVTEAEAAEEAASQETAEETVPETTVAPTVPEDGNPEDVTCKGTYSAEDEAVIAARDKVVATAGEHQLTLGQLQVFYWMQFRNFMSQYSAYASYFGLDVTQSLDTQVCALSENGVTWQQFFLERALESWASYCSMAAEADANGFEITEEQRSELDNATAELEETALANGYASGEDMLHSSLGAAATEEDYVYFMELYYKANGYYAQVANSVEPTDQELEAFFQAHAEGYEGNGITQQTKSVDVRHILIAPVHGDSTAQDAEYTEEEWAAAEKLAQDVLEEFLAGDKTQDAFAALANQRSQDPGSNQNGGLYEGVKEGQMVPAFNDWCFDESRQEGDTGIVKTDYGYHVMYFVGSELLWAQYARSDYAREQADKLLDEVMAQSPLTVQYADILLASSVIH